MERTDILLTGANSGKPKVISMALGMVRNGHGHLVHKTLKSAVF